MSKRPLKSLNDLNARKNAAVSGTLNIFTTASFNVFSIPTSSAGMYSVDYALHAFDQNISDNYYSIKNSYDGARFKAQDNLDINGNAVINLTADAPAGATYFNTGNLADISIDLLVDTNNNGIYRNDLASVQLSIQTGSLIAEISAPGASNKPYRFLAVNEAALLALYNLSGSATGSGGSGSGGANVSASYIVVNATPTLPNERQLAAGSGVSLTDNGPGNTIVISVSNDQPGTDSSATPGNATINKPSGISAISSGTNNVTITNSLANTNSKIMVTWLGDHGAARFWVTRAAGSFTVNISTNASANTSFCWEVASLI